MNEIELEVLDMSSVLKPSDSYALVLQEVGIGDRKLALIIGALEAQAIKIVQLHYKVFRPFTHDLMLSVLREGGLTIKKAVIYAVKNGIFFSYIYVLRPDGSEYKVDARTTDAISLSMRDGFPLYIYEDILEEEKLRNFSPDGSTYTMTVNAVDIDLLRQAMDEAVKQEDYERASELRDEIKRREKEGINENDY